MDRRPSPALRVLVAVAIACASCVAIARRPIAVLDALQPWASNGNSTSFVLYDDGLVIYASKSLDSLHPYLQARLTKEELAELSPPASLLSLKRGYITLQASDVPEYRLHFTVGEHHSGISILGFLHQIGGCGGCQLARLPTALDEYLGRIIRYSNPHATPWQPQEMQVEIAPASGRPTGKWPSDWPDLKSAMTIKFNSLENSPDWYCIALPGKDWAKLHQLVQSLGRNGTFAMDTNSWSIVQTRFVLPEEYKWNPIGACHPSQ